MATPWAEIGDNLAAVQTKRANISRVSQARSLPTLSNPIVETGAQRGRGALASRSHTAALIGLIIAVAVTGTLLEVCGAPRAVVPVGRATENSRIFAQYLPLLLVNWGLVLYVSRLFRARNALPELLGRRWQSFARASTDLALAVLAALLILLSETLAMHYLAVGRNAAASALLPASLAERGVWVLVAASVGFSEEVVYRGYLQSQLSAFTRSSTAGVALQALLFAIAHSEQGVAAALRIGIYGLVFGALARVRGSLFPGIVCHVGVDLASGLLG
jgi:uncharacterized protein